MELSALTQVSRKYFSVAEYHRMAEAGIIGPEERVELIRGELIAMSPAGSQHAACIDRLNRIFVKNLSEDVIVRVQNPVVIDDRSEPEPDIALVKFQPDFYEKAHPRPAAILLVVEVSDSTLRYDRQVKLPLYAEAGIKETWIVDLNEGNVEVHTSPSEQGYECIRIFRSGRSILSEILQDFEVFVDDII